MRVGELWKYKEGPLVMRITSTENDIIVLKKVESLSWSNYLNAHRTSPESLKYSFHKYYTFDNYYEMLTT